MEHPAPQLPPFFYAPVTTLPDQPDVPRLLMHEIEGSHTAVFVYSALDRLATMYGADVAWVATDRAGLEKARQVAPFDVVVLDRTLVRQEPAPQAPPGVFVAGQSTAAPSADPRSL